MTGTEAKVREAHPMAYAVRQTTFSGSGYYLVYPNRRASMYIGVGDTKVQAWKNAAETVRRSSTTSSAVEPGTSTPSED